MRTTTMRRLGFFTLAAVLLATFQAAPRTVLHSQTAPQRLYLPRVSKNAVQVRQWIGPEGGTIEINLGDLEDVRVDVPPGAVDEPTLFSLQAGTDVDFADGICVGIPVEFGPHGVPFHKPVKVTLTFDPEVLPPGVTAADLFVVDDNPSPSRPERIQPVAVGEYTVEIEVEEFSTFHVQAPLTGAECPTAAPPAGCTPLALPSGAPGPLLVDRCYLVASADQPYRYSYVNVVQGGTLYFADDGGKIDFRASAILVEQGGTVQAGAWCRPFGTNGGRLAIGLWGTDPTNQGKQAATQAGIRCKGALGDGRCYPAALDNTSVAHYCTGSDPADPCAGTTPDANGANARFDGYGNLNYDDNPFGYKVLAVSYGGSLSLYGQRGVRPTDLLSPMARLDACPTAADPAAGSGFSWARLAGSTASGDMEITLDRPVDWQTNDQIVIGTTDWYVSHSEVATVASNDGNGKITLQAKLVWPHSGEKYTLPADVSQQTGSTNAAVETRAAVGLLSRSIVVQSLGATADSAFPDASACGAGTDNPDCYFGGHTMVRQGFGRFEVQGVEFRQLGQGGRMGHYPVHFHMAKSTDYTNAFVKDSSIWDSNTRFLTVHGTHDVAVARNVGYLSVGHGYYLEDGSEIQNLLCHNLAVSSHPATLEYYQAQPADSPTHRLVPPILDHAVGSQVAGGDTYMPVAFWTMNTYNEMVGNQAVGVGGYGSCYWLLGSGLSGHSADAHVHWTSGSLTDEDYAGFNLPGARQAPLKRFQGNGCTTAAYALQTSFDTAPTVPSLTGYTAVVNPYALDDGMRPRVSGNYQPTHFAQNPNCQQGIHPGGSWDPNVASCTATVIDGFTTSFNWAEAGFGAVWLRPMWYAFFNSAVTDQLFGGLGFVSGGSWAQVPPGYFTLTKDSIFVGSTQDGQSPYASKTGPAFVAPPGAPDGFAPPNCNLPGKPPCRMAADGTGLFQDGFNPKRLITIYDGPFYADSNAFTNVGRFDCDPQDFASCGIYLTTVQPGTADQMQVLDAAIGWKQPNAFYYPPAFAFRKSGFGAGVERHNVFDQYADYVQGNTALLSQPALFQPLGSRGDVSPIDFGTILLDLDGTLTGAVPPGDPHTASLSINRFFDAPSQMPECLSFGVQTSPYRMVTTVAAKLSQFGESWAVDNTSWLAAGPQPAVPIYRQLTLPSDMPGGTDPCAAGGICNGTQWGCNRATFMAGGQNGQAPYLTTNNGVYYIDTAPQSLSCVRLGGFHLAGFQAGSTYALYHLFPQKDTRVTYQVYVGDSFQPASDGFWFRVTPHVSRTSGNDLMVYPTALPGGQAAVNNGVLTVVLDNSLIADSFDFTARADKEKCLPRDFCQIAPDGGGCVVADRYKGTDLEATIDDACRYWVTATAGATAANEGLNLADCPEGGCLGYAFTLPADFTPKSYPDAGGPALATCFPNNSTWNVPLTVIDPACTAAPPPTFCK